MSYLKLCSSQQLQEIYEELNITEESLKNDVEYLMQWLEQTPHLPKIKSRETLENFLIGCKNSVERTKLHIDYYYSRRSLRQDLFAYRDPCSNEIKEAFKIIGLIPLPKLTPECYRIVIFRVFKHDPKTLPRYDCLLSSYQLQYEIINKVDKNKGVILIMDFQNITLGLGTMIVQDFKTIADLSQKTNLMRWKKVIITNPEPIVQQMVTLSKTFLSKKLSQRAEVWKKDRTDLVEIVPKEVLPSTYGGTEASIDELSVKWFEYVAQFRDWFKSEENVNADMTKRPTDDPLSAEFSSTGLAGSFRKIAID